MSGSWPGAMQVAAPGEEKGSAAIPVELILDFGEAAEGFPCIMLRILDGEDPVWPLCLDASATLADRQNPGIVANEVGAAAAIGPDLTGGLSRVCRAEQDDQLVPRKARWIDVDSGSAAERNIWNSEPECSRGHRLNITQPESAITP